MPLSARACGLSLGRNSDSATPPLTGLAAHREKKATQARTAVWQRVPRKGHRWLAVRTAGRGAVIRPSAAVTECGASLSGCQTAPGSRARFAGARHVLEGRPGLLKFSPEKVQRLDQEENFGVDGGRRCRVRRLAQSNPRTAALRNMLEITSRYTALLEWML
jgi:hypothetical protein